MPLLLLAAAIMASSAPDGFQFYRFDDNLNDARVQAAAETPAAQSPAVQPPRIELPGSPATGWTCSPAGGRIGFTESGLLFDAAPGGLLASPQDLAIDGAATDAILLEMSVAGAPVVSLKWRVEGAAEPEAHHVLRIPIPRPGEMLLYRLPMARIEAWRHYQIDQLFLTTEHPAQIELQSLACVHRRAQFRARPAGRIQYAAGDQIRPALYTRCNTALRYRVVIPPGAAFTSGITVVDDARPVEFQLQVEANGVSRTFSKTTQDARRWDEARFDLDEFAGQLARVTLASTCADPGQIAVWGSPILFQTCPPATTSPDPRPPNVLLYVVDCLRADHTQLHAYKRATTPNMLAFSDRAVYFDHCFTQDTWTKASMASLAAGVDQLYHNVDHYGDMLPAQFVTLPEILRAAGWHTGVITENPHTPPETEKIAVYDHIEPVYLRIDTAENSVAWPDLPNFTYDAASSFIKKNADRPFFLYVHTMEAHDVRPPGGMYTYDVPNQFQLWKTDGVPNLMDLYDGGIAHADQNFKRLLDTLDQLGLAQHTLVIITADHGEAFGEHEGFLTHNGKPFNTLVHVPLAFRFPGRLLAPGRISQNVQLLDIAPTILDLLSLPSPHQFQGQTLAPLLRSRTAPGFDTRVIVSTWRARVVSAVQGPYKLMHDLDENHSALFNLHNDPAEYDDLAPQNPEIVARLLPAIANHLERQKKLHARLPKQPTQQAPIDPANLERLKTLGYF